MPKQNVKLLLNSETDGHLDRLVNLIGKSKTLEFVVAFAKVSGWKEIKVALLAGLEKGLQARVTVGLSFYQTEPEFLRQLFKLHLKYPSLLVFVGDTPQTFHPKVYAFNTGRKRTVVIGSANLTSGGFYRNYEASVEIDDTDGTLMAEVAAHIDQLIAGEVIEPLTQALILTYQRKYSIHKIHQAVAERKAAKAMETTDFDVDTLQAALSVLRDDKTENGFDALVAGRRRKHSEANTVMRQLIEEPPSTREDFLEGYEALIGQFSSGGLQRGKTRIANNYQHFIAALGEAQTLKQVSPADAYDALADYFTDIDRAGVNVLTEILLTLDSERFANMNKNAVAGMARANITQFPERPLKTNMNAQLYADYCRQASRLRERLGLRDFVELDTLFNHLYWNKPTYGKRVYRA